MEEKLIYNTSVAISYTKVVERRSEQLESATIEVHEPRGIENAVNMAAISQAMLGIFRETAERSSAETSDQKQIENDSDGQGKPPEALTENDVKMILMSSDSRDRVTTIIKSFNDLMLNTATIDDGVSLKKTHLDALPYGDIIGLLCAWMNFFVLPPLIGQRRPEIAG